jgi:hypothetical protein
MWKILVAFIVFAVAAVYMLMQGGADVDMSGEKHGAEATHVEEPATPAASAAASQ